MPVSGIIGASPQPSSAAAASTPAAKTSSVTTNNHGTFRPEAQAQRLPTLGCQRVGGDASAGEQRDVEEARWGDPLKMYSTPSATSLV